MPSLVTKKKDTMKHFIKITKALILLFSVAMLFSACNKDDDIEEIFTGKAWNLTFIQDGVKRIVPQEGNYILYFGATDFSFITPSGNTITGNWIADGNSRSFICDKIATNGNIDNDIVAKSAMSVLKNAIRYDGDANWIQIIEQPNNIYMQFYNR